MQFVVQAARFHSISFASEWGVGPTNLVRPLRRCRSVSIQLVSPGSGEFVMEVNFLGVEELGFHSISFPSEWGVYHGRGGVPLWIVTCVSIQLVSPASGE